LRDAYLLRGPVLLRLGLHCYALKANDDRLLVWRQVRSAPPENVVRMSLFDTTSLKPIRRASKGRPGDPIIYESGLLGEVDLPASWEVGLHPFAFPEAMRGIPEVLVLVHTIEGWDPRLRKRDWKARRLTTIYCVRPTDSVVDALPLNWARSIEGHFHWIARIVRDPMSGKILGDGAGVGRFLLDDRANFLGWIRKTKATA
jgi:hypothetical protein